MSKPLKKVASYSKFRISLDEIDLNTYISTDNLLQNKKGKVPAEKMPTQSSNNVTRFDKGDILVANIRPYLKKIWLAQYSGGCSSDVLTFKVKEDFDSTFVYYSLFRDDFFEHMMNGSKGTKMPRGDKNQILEFSVPDFNLKTQKQIAKVLSDLDAKIEVNNKINQELEAMAKTLYDYWFVQFEFPTTEAQAKQIGNPCLVGKPYKSSGGKMVFNEELKREIPDGWEVKSLSDIEHNIITGKTPSTKISEYFDGDIPFITIDDIRQGLYIFKAERTLTELGAQSQSNKYLYENDICVSCIGTIGVIGFVGKLSQSNQQINSISKPKNYNRYFLYQYLKDFFAFNTGAKKGAVLSNMNKGEFEAITVLDAPIELKETYFKTVDSFFKNISKNIKQNQKLSELRDWLLPMLMNGQVRVAHSHENGNLGEVEQEFGMVAEENVKYGKL